MDSPRSTLFLLGLFSIWLAVASAMSPARIAELRQETVEMFYHGFDNYMNVAFPEDEVTDLPPPYGLACALTVVKLRPISCVPLTRDSRNPRNVELNDVLGNYSLTLIDSLSTLAILASAPPDRSGTGRKALRDFQDGVASLVLQYGDGTGGPSGQGLRARGFDVDSKVQVFETVIRGVGGLVSAHLFAAGELPIHGYTPRKAAGSKRKLQKGEIPALAWPNGFKYDGQLLRLALDLGERLLPAFYTATGMPYPRVNLRHGIPFYQNSPLNQNSDPDDYVHEGGPEITETCSAGAGSLVLEFTVLSRLTGDVRFEQLGKRAFWAVWARRSDIGLIGAGVDAENGQWIAPYAGIGAGADSFFEYALKTHILLSGHAQPNLTAPFREPRGSWLDPNSIHSPLSVEENSSEAFLAAWHEAHAAIKRHLYSGTHHPHYVNAHLTTGSPQAYWIDSLGAYYPGLLTLAGEVEEAISTNLLYTALWTRYAALPERWSVRDGQVEGGLGWWPGRPEFIESNYHLYRATRDPWYLHVGEMVLADIKSRCWTKCGWSGLQDVRTGEKSDRMESFFLGETAKYLYLLFDTDHPLNSLDAAYVFTTEGHPLLIPKEKGARMPKRKTAPTQAVRPYESGLLRDTCPVPPSAVPLTISVTASRPDIFHASSLIGLHLIPNTRAIGSVDDRCMDSVANHTYYPWTLPDSLMPLDGMCSQLPLKNTLSIEFPASSLANSAAGSNFVLGSQALIRLNEGILVRSLSGLRLGMVYESPSPFMASDGPLLESWRVWSLANMPLGRDEQVFIPRDVVGEMTDPSFTRIRDTIMADIIIQLESSVPESAPNSDSVEDFFDAESDLDIYNEGTGPFFEESSITGIAAEYRTIINSLFRQVTSALRDPAATAIPEPQTAPAFRLVPVAAIAPTGMGAAPIREVVDAPDPNQSLQSEPLSWSRIYFAGESCAGKLPDEAAKNHDIIVMRRGGCTFTEKLATIPSFVPTKQSLKLVIVISGPEDDEEEMNGPPKADGSHLIRPLLDKAQVTPSGLVRHHQISMLMVGGGETTEFMLRKSKSVGLRRRYHIESQGLVVGNIRVV